jgi:hypothetical protein
LHFQWDEREPNTSDLLHAETQIRVVKLFCDRVRQKTMSLFTSTGRSEEHGKSRSLPE